MLCYNIPDTDQPAKFEWSGPSTILSFCLQHSHYLLNMDTTMPAKTLALALKYCIVSHGCRDLRRITE